MKSYKGFNKDMTCRGFPFEEGKEYYEDNAELCKNGFHACLNPLDCFGYYVPADSVYHEVELDDVTEEKSVDSKVCGKRIKIGARLSVATICKLHFDFVKSQTTHTVEEVENSASAGECGAAVSRGFSEVGEYGCAVVRGNNVKVKAGIGAVIVIVNENYSNHNIKEWKVGVIDNKSLKPDTWYKLKNGEFVEVEEDEEQET